MEFQKIINLIGDDVESRFQTKDYVAVNDANNNDYNGEEIRIKTTMLRSSLCDYSKAYIKVKGMVDFTNLTAGKKGRFVLKNCAPFRSCSVKINHTVIDEQEFLDLVMPMYNLIEYSDNYAKTTGSLHNFHRDEPADDIWDSPSVKEKAKYYNLTENAAAGALNKSVEVEINVPFSYLSNFWRTLEFPLINCEVELQLKWSPHCVLGWQVTQTQLTDDITAPAELAGNNDISFRITDTTTYVPVVTLRSIEGDKLLRKLERGFTKTVNWNRPRVNFIRVNSNVNMDILLDASFQGINRLFLLAYNLKVNAIEGGAEPRNYTQNIMMPIIQIDKYNVVLDGRNFFDTPISKDDFRGYENLREICIGDGDDYTVGSLLDYNYVRDHYKIIAVDLSRQKVLRCKSACNTTNKF